MLNESLDIDIVLVDLKQRHCSSFSELLKPFENSTVPKYRGEVVKAAVKSGWFVSPTWDVDEIENMKANRIRWIAEQLATVFTQMMELDPKQ